MPGVYITRHGDALEVAGMINRKEKADKRKEKSRRLLTSEKT